MAGSIYNPGDLVTLQARWSVNDLETDPSTVSIQVKDPSGNITTYSYGGAGAVVRDSVGNYHVNITVNTTGVWYYRVLGAGSVQKNGEDSFLVSSSQFV